VAVASELLDEAVFVVAANDRVAQMQKPGTGKE
jgi:hypothetical protein